MLSKFLFAIFFPLAVLSTPIFLKTDSVAVPTSGGTSLGTLFQIKILSDGSKLVMGNSTARLGKISSDGESYTTINYDVALGSPPNEFIANGNTSLLINNSTTLSRYDISGSTANFVASTTVPSGTTSMSFSTAGNLLLGKATTLRTLSPTLLTTIGSDLTSSATMQRNGVNSDDAHIYLTSTGLLRKFVTGTSDDVLVVNALGSGASVHKGLVVMPDSTAYVAPVVSGAGTIKKINSTGTILWSYSVSASMIAMAIDAAGKIAVLRSTGEVENYLPIIAPTSFTGTPTSTSIALSWTNGVTDSDFSGVMIRRSTSEYPADTTSGNLVSSNDTNTTLNDSGLSPDTTYYYSIWNKTSDGFYSTKVQLSKQTVFSAPEFSAEASGSSVALAWTVPAGVGTFTIRKSTSSYPTSVSNGSAVATDLDAAVTTYDETSVADGTYYYSLFAKRSSDDAYAEAAHATVTVDGTPPDAPELSASKVTANGNTINLDWNVPATTNTFTLKKIVDGGVETTVQSGITSATTTYSQTGLSDGAYVYKIYAVDSAGNISNAGSASSITIDSTAPSAPSSFAASASSSTVNLSWSNPVSDFASVTIRRSASAYPTSITDGTAIVSGSISTSYSNTGLSDGTYYYSIFALDSFGNISSAANISTTVDTTAPNAPSLSASKATLNGTTINLSWNAPSTTDHFILKVIYNGGSETTVQSSIAVSTTTSSQTGLSDGTYVYKIYAVDSFGNTSNAGAATSLTIDTTSTSAPSSFSLSVSGTEVNVSTAALSWTNPVASDFSSVIIKRSTSAYPTNISEGTTVASSLTSTSYSDSSLADGTYYYSIFAFDNYGNISAAATATTTIETNTNIAIDIQMRATGSEILVNDNLSFELSIENSGNRDAADTELTFTLSDSLQFVSAEVVASFLSASIANASFIGATSASCTGTSVITCGLGAVPAGETVRLVVTTRVVSAGAISFSVSGGDGLSGDSTSSSGTAVSSDSTTTAAPYNGPSGCSLNLQGGEENFFSSILLLFLTSLSLLSMRGKRGQEEGSGHLSAR